MTELFVQEASIDCSEFLDVMSLAAMQVGRVALQFYGKVANSGKEVGDAYPEGPQRLAAEAVSDVDLAAQEILLLALAVHFPHVRLEAEEATETVARFAHNRSRYTVVVDPIDGTLNYLEQLNQFAVLVGLVEDDRYVASVAYFPLLDNLYRAVRDEGCTLTRAGETKRVRTGSAPKLILHGISASPRLKRAITALGYEAASSRCSAVDASVAAMRVAAASVSARPPSIRRSIGALVSREAGGYLCDAHGRPYDCTYPRGLDSLVVASSQQIAESLLPALEREVAGEG